MSEKMEIKSFRVDFKTQIEGDRGTVTALVACFNNVDFGNDRILPNAFDATVKEWKDRGDPLPVIWSHNWDDPMAFVGHVDVKDISITQDGLEVKLNYDLTDPVSRKVFYLQKNRIVTQFSFGYFTDDVEMVHEKEFGMVRNIKSLELFECGPTLLGMNPETRLLEVASLNRNKGTKTGRVLSSANETSLTTARDLLNEVLSSVDSGDGADGKSLDPRELQKKSIIGSVEALQDRVADALEDAYCDGWPLLRGVIPAGSSGGVVVFDYYDGNSWECETFQQSFADDGSVVTLVDDRKQVDILEVVVADADASREADMMSRTKSTDGKSDTGSTIIKERVFHLMTLTRN